MSASKAEGEGEDILGPHPDWKRTPTSRFKDMHLSQNEISCTPLYAGALARPQSTMEIEDEGRLSWECGEEGCSNF